MMTENTQSNSCPSLWRCSLGRCSWLCLLSIFSLGFLSGCGYQIGPSFSEEIRSISVPVFKNTTFRRGMELQLTEAVQNEIKLRSHFLLANPSEADTVLTGEIVEIRKDVLGETQFDDPRELQFSLAVKLTWSDNRTGNIIDQHRIPIEQNAVSLISQADFAPEVGHSGATATKDAVTRLARQIVDRMETPW